MDICLAEAAAPSDSLFLGAMYKYTYSLTHSMHGLNWRAKRACVPNKWGQTGIVGTTAKKFWALCARNFSHTQFLPHDAMRKRGLCCRPVSICLSVHHVGALYPDG